MVRPRRMTRPGESRERSAHWRSASAAFLLRRCRSRATSSPCRGSPAIPRATARQLVHRTRLPEWSGCTAVSGPLAPDPGPLLRFSSFRVITARLDALLRRWLSGSENWSYPPSIFFVAAAVSANSAICRQASRFWTVLGAALFFYVGRSGCAGGDNRLLVRAASRSRPKPVRPLGVDSRARGSLINGRDAGHDLRLAQTPADRRRHPDRIADAQAANSACCFPWC